MPGYRVHIAGAFFLYLILLYAMYLVVQPSWFLCVELCGCMIIGALFPDIDIKSKGQKYFYGMIVLTLISMLIYEFHVQAAWFSVLCMMPMLVRHRGIFHNVYFLLGLPLATWTLFYSYNIAAASAFKFHFIFFTIGCLSHVWLDIGTARFIKSFTKKRRKKFFVIKK